MKCTKCGMFYADKLIRTVYIDGNPYKICPKCEKLYHLLTVGLKKIFATTTGILSHPYDYCPCMVCCRGANGFFKLSRSLAFSVEVGLCKRCSSRLKGKANMRFTRRIKKSSDSEKIWMERRESRFIR